MPNNIAVSITADVADLQVKLAIARAEMATTSKTLRDLATAAKDSGDLTAEQKTALLAAGDAYAKNKNQVNLYAGELKALSPAIDKVGHASAGATRELLVLSHEAIRGDFKRMTGSASILAGQLGILTPTVVATGAAIAAIALPVAIFGIAAEQGAEQLAKFDNAMAATNNYAGVTISQLQSMSREMATWAHGTIGSATEEMMKLAGSGKFTSKTLLLIGEDATRMAQLTGESTDKFNEQFEKMGDGVAKFAKDYQDKYHQLTTAQYEYIRQLEEQGDKEGAEYALAKNVYDYLGKEAPEKLGLLESAWLSVKKAVSASWDAMKAVGRDSNQDQIKLLDQQITNMKRGRGGNENDPAVVALEKRKAAIEAAEAAQQKLVAQQAASARTQTEGVDAAAKLKDQFEESKTSGEKLRVKIKEINDELAKSVAANPQGKAMYEQEAAAARAQATKSFTPHAPKGESAVSKMQDELDAKKLLWAQEQDAHGTAIEFDKKLEADYWKAILDNDNLSSKERGEVTQKYLAAHSALIKKDIAEEIAGYKLKLDAAKGDADARMKLAQDQAAYIKVKFGEESPEFRAAQGEIVRIARENAEERRRIEDDLAKTVQQLRDIELSDEQRDAEYRVKMGLETSRELIQQEKDIAKAKHDAAVTSINSQIDATPASEKEKRAALYNQLRVLDAKYYSDLKTLEQKAALDRTAIGRTAITAYANSWSQSLAKLLTLQAGFGTTLKSLYQGTANVISGALASVIEKWIIKKTTAFAVEHGLMSASTAASLTGEAAKTAAATAGAASRTAAETTANVAAVATQKAAAIAQLGTLVGLAGAGGVASMAAAPFPLDLGAPAFGASMAAAAGSFGTMAALATGTNYVPNDMIAQIHAGERIIPKAENQELMAAVKGGAGADKGGGDRQASTSGDAHQHLHLHGDIIHNPAQLEAWFKRNASAVGAGVQRYVRNGGKTMAA